MTTRHVAKWITILAALGGCATAPPKELVDARAAYNHASTSRAADLKPAELHKARESLLAAETALKNDGDTAHTRDMAYVAQRKAQLAEALAGQDVDAQTQKSAEQAYQAQQAQIQRRTKQALTQAQKDLQQSEGQRQLQSEHSAAQIQSEQQARHAAEAKAAEAEARSKELTENLAKLAEVKEEERGLVITLSGSVLFASNQTVLLPEAQTRLNQVAEALLGMPERNILIEGHTDSRGNSSYNMDLSQRRADAVRSYLVSRGIPTDLIRAQGYGKTRPVTDNKTAEGRANNRRVEIVVEPKKAFSTR
jgi:outer membrane protein OmpA-like peptidoglycan-associated protein